MLFRTNQKCGCVSICVTWVVRIIDNCLKSRDCFFICLWVLKCMLGHVRWVAEFVK